MLPWCNFSCNFLMIGLNSRFWNFPVKFLVSYLSQEILIFFCNVQFLEKNETGFLE